MYRFFVYIMANKVNTVLYTGITNNLARRVLEHKSKTIDGFTKRYNVTKLVYYEEFQYVLNAIAREKQIKKWRRKKKFEILINKMNPKMLDLAADINNLI